MTPNQIQLVQSSFAKVVPISDQAAAIFYSRLFELAPDVRALFKGDMVEQGRKLMTMLGSVTRGLGNLDTLAPVAQRLAERHVGYGAQPAHYAVVGTALIDTLDKGLGEEFTPDVRSAWETAYGTLSDVMIAAAQKTAAA
ncbi:globin family protein [Variovorax robiniae]|uniref:Globin family protein n=1 Tax=Variovorax robiniae TaxID=1836199 RepID=A0ABU8X6J7_9BURK